MSSLYCATSMRSAVASRTTQSFGKPAVSTRRVLATRTRTAASQQDAAVTRRESLAAAAAAVATASSLLTASPALAFLGLGDDTEKVIATYTADTTRVLNLTNETLAFGRDDPGREEKVKELRKEINNWVAAYRRQDKVAGRPSFGNTYSALNALAGHFNSFGVEAPVPKKRLERLTKELKDAQLYLSRNR